MGAIMTLDGKSTLVPAACGATCWAIAGFFGKRLHLEDDYAFYLVIVLAALFAALMVARIKIKTFWERPVYWFLNTLIIVTIGSGATATVNVYQEEKNEATRSTAPTVTPTPPAVANPAPPPTEHATPPLASRPSPQPPPTVVVPNPPQDAPRAVIKEVAKELGKRLKKPF